MAADCKCPSCGDYKGKDTECSYYASCSNCGNHWINARGDKEYQPTDKSAWKSAYKPTVGRSVSYGRRW